MSSVGDVGRGATDAPSDDLSQRATAAARAFAALNLDGPGGAGRGDAGSGDGGRANTEVIDAEVVEVGTTEIVEAEIIDAGNPDTEIVDAEVIDADVIDAEVIDERGPAAAPDGARRDDGPLRPDAVLRDFTVGATAPTTGQVRDTPTARDTARVRGPAEERAAAWAEATTARPHLRDGRATAPTVGGTTSGGLATRPEPAAGTAPPRASGAGPASRADGYLLDLGAAALASFAFVWPRTWLALVVVAATAALLVRVLVEHGLGAGVVMRGLGARLRPGPLGRFATLVLLGTAVAVAVPALVCGGLWLLRHGSAGTAVAARVGAWAYSPRFAVVLACYVLIAGTGAARERRVALVGRLTAQSDASVVGIAAVGAAAIAVLVAVVVPRSGSGSNEWAPAWIDGRLDRLRTVVIEAEVAAAAGCLARAQQLPWQAVHDRGSDRVGLVLQDALPAQGDVTTALVALHNQLAPWVRTIEIGGPGQVVLAIDRSRLPSAEPLDDPQALVEAASAGTGLVAQDAAGYDRELALDCSLSPVV